MAAALCLCVPQSVTWAQETAAADSARTQETPAEDFRYTVLNDGTAEISGYSGSDTRVVIPAAIDGKTVTSIGTEAFKDCSGLTEVTIPGSVTTIGESAFSGCSGLTEVTIPGSVTSIGYYSFSGCNNLGRIAVDSGNKVFDSRENCNAIIKTESNTLVIGCKTTVIPGSVNRIGNHAFHGCSGLTEVSIPAGVTSIEDSAFRSCSGLTEVSIPAGVTSIGHFAFRGCSGLAKVSIPDSVTRIAHYAFYGCSGLTEVVIPGSVTRIDPYAFTGCSGLTKLSICDGVTGIGNYTFEGCSGLTEVTIPASVSRIGYHAFENCSGLTKLSICDGVTSIGDDAFHGCGRLTEVSIPASVSYLGNDAFHGCSRLTEVTIPASVTTIGVSPFEGCSENLVLYVQAGSYAEKYAKDNKLNYKTVNGGNSSGQTTASCKMILSKTSYTYNGKTRKPSVTVKNGDGKKLKSGTDYTVSYPKKMKSVGHYTVTVKLKGSYSGTLKEDFEIIPKGTSISKLITKKKGFTVKWKKQAAQTTGYEIACSTNKKFPKKNTKIMNVGKSKTVSKNITGLKGKKKYYVRIRTYKKVKVNKKSTKIYSSWSKVKNVTTQK